MTNHISSEQNRLTKRILEHVYYTKGAYSETLPIECTPQDVRDILKRLADYEDIGTLEEIKQSIDVLNSSRSDIARLIADYPNEMWLDEDKQAWEDVGNMGIASIDRSLSTLSQKKG